METMTVRSEPSMTVTEGDGEPAASSTQQAQPVLRLRLQKKTKSDRKVEWREDTIDNEHMGKKKSKCCCIYKKPTKFGESSSEDDEECEHCFGHPEKRRRNKKDGDETPHEHNEANCDAADGTCNLTQ